MKLKQCEKCHKKHLLNSENFHKSNKFPDYYSRYCKSCGLHHLERKALLKKDSTEKLGDDTLICTKCKKEKNRNHYNFQYSNNSKTGYSKQCKKCINSTKKAYRKMNTMRTRIQSQKERAKVYGVNIDFTVDDWLYALKYFKNKCAYCSIKPTALEIEHIKAVTRGGSLTPKNIIPACKNCNSSKNIQPLQDWYPKQPFYSADRMDLVYEYIKNARLSTEDNN